MYRVISHLQNATEAVYRLQNKAEVKYTGHSWKDQKKRLYTPVKYKGVIVGFTCKATLSSQEIQLYSLSAEGKAYIAYNTQIGGSMIGLEVPVGYLKGVEDLGGVVAVYEICIKRGITWEELLNCYYEYEPSLVDGGWKTLETAYKLLLSL